MSGAARNNLEEYKHGKQASFYTEYLGCTGRKLVADSVGYETILSQDSGSANTTID
jgi:hypothetical protein